MTQLPALAQVLVGFVVFDFLVYWARWSHEVPFLWRFTRSALDRDDGLGLRIPNHPIDGIILAPPIAFLLARASASG